jgi:hypothetical protein
MSVTLALSPRPVSARHGDLEIPAALDRQLRRSDPELQRVRSGDEAATTGNDAGNRPIHD